MKRVGIVVGLLVLVALVAAAIVASARVVGDLAFLGIYLVAGIFLVYGGIVFAFFYYRHIRREEVRHLLAAAAQSGMPLESALRAYVDDRPRNPLRELVAGTLLFFLLPGYYWLWYRRNSFDARVERLADRLEEGSSLRTALRGTGVATAETSLAAAVGEATGKLGSALRRASGEDREPLWLTIVPRLLYPVMILVFMLFMGWLMMVFIVPKFEKIFLDLKRQLPEATETLIAAGRYLAENSVLLIFTLMGLILLFSFASLSSNVCWYCPGVGRLYRMNQRGRALTALGVLLEEGMPLPTAIALLNNPEFFPDTVCRRLERLRADVERGQALAEAMRRHGLLPRAMVPLVHAADRARNLPWALVELGDHLARRTVRLAQRWSLILFPITVLLVAVVVGFVVIALFLPLVHLIEGVGR